MNPTRHPFRLSILIPVYNEEKTVALLLDKVKQAPFDKEIVVVDDGSTDGTREILEGFDDPFMHVIFHEVNIGKGAALRTAINSASGDILIFQDADLEYDPKEYPFLLQPILDGMADVVYGSRFAGHGAHRVFYFWHYVGNRILTLLSNIFTNINLTDMECGYKVFTRQALKGITIEQSGFGVEPEITAKIARKRLRIYEVPISYYGRTYEEGKKVGWRDGLQALWCVLKYNLG